MFRGSWLNSCTASRLAVGANRSSIERTLKGLKALSWEVQQLSQLFRHIHKVKDKRKYSTIHNTLLFIH